MKFLLGVLALLLVIALPVLAALGLWTAPTVAEATDLLKGFLPATAFMTALYAVYSKDARVRANSESLLIAVIASSVSDFILVAAITAGRVSAAPFKSAAPWLTVISFVIQLVAFVYLLGVFVKTYNQVYNLRTNKVIKYFGPLKWFREKFGSRKSYEYNGASHSYPEGSLPGIKDFLGAGDLERLEKGGAILLKGNTPYDALELALGLLVERVQAGETATVVVADRHPYDLASGLQALGLTHDFSNRIVFVDAFSSSLGFTDDIHGEKTAKMPDLGFKCFPAKTFAGIHTALGQAFNHFKRRDSEGLRKPSLNMFAYTSVLADFESEEQFRIFWRHVIPSERSYGMLTFVVEDHRLSSDMLEALEVLCTHEFSYAYDSSNQSSKLSREK